MKILEKRPLALILCIMLGGFSFFADLANSIKIILSAVALLANGLIYIFDNLNKGRKPIVIVSLIAFSASLMLSALWSTLFFPNEYYDSNVQITARIYSIDNTVTRLLS